MARSKPVKNTQTVNVRLLIVIIGISVLLAIVISAIIVTPKTYFVRVVDNLFLGGIMNLLLYLLMNFRANAEKKAFGDLIEAREKNRTMPKEDRLKLRQYDVFRMLRFHFGVASIVVFLFSAIGTIIAMV